MSNGGWLDKEIVRRMIQCFEKAKELLSERDKDIGCDSHFSYEDTEVAVALFRAGYGARELTPSLKSNDIKKCKFCGKTECNCCPKCGSPIDWDAAEPMCDKCGWAE